MISNKSYYGIVSLVYLATNARGKHVGLREIAGTQNIPLRFLEQVFSRLKGAEIVSSVRGAGGGYRLARSPREISLAEILSACEGRSEFAVNSNVFNRIGDSDVVGKTFLTIMKAQLGEFRRNVEKISLRDLIEEAGLSAEMYYI